MNVPSKCSVKEANDRSLTRVVLLGASNLSLSWPRIMDQLNSRFREPLDVITAHGMGRSYVCDDSGFAWNRLPGIMHSEIWDSRVPRFDNSATFGLLTDFGNDLLYGREPEEIAAAAAECIRRLRSWDPTASIVMTRPPVESVNTLGWLRFCVSRFVLFPFSALTLPLVKAKTIELDERLQQVASELQVPIYQPHAHWYGVDPIHVKWRYQTDAFAAMMNLWGVECDKVTRSTNRKRPTPALRWWFGREKRKPQPSVCDGGTSVFAY